MIRVLVVEDSAVVREFLTYVLASDPWIEVIGTAKDGEEAVAAAMQARPDVITMDINMPRMDGFEATRRIMETAPAPIVIVSGSYNVNEVTTSFRAIEAGALALVPRPMGPGHPEHESTVKQLLRTVRLMSEVKVVKRWPRSRTASTATPAQAKEQVARGSAQVDVVAIGASTGGPIVIQTILSKLRKGLPAPLVIVQHMAAGFIHGFVEWLGQSTGFPVHLAAHDTYAQPGHAYVAPDDFHAGVRIGGRIVLSRDEPENGLRPSVSYLFRSVANEYGANAAGVLLSGMGKDGAQELKLMRDRGAVTIAQDEESSIVHGMPGEAIKLDAATHVLAADKIAPMVEALIRREVGCS